MTHLDEVSLIEGCRHGDFDCFERLVERYEKKVYNLALRMLKNPEDARDVLQETFMKVYDHLAKFRGDARLSTWIYRITMNEALMRIRREKGRTVSLNSFKSSENEYQELDVADWSDLPSERALTKELGMELEKATSLLPEDYRAVFLLRDVEGLSNAEIAGILKITVPAVKSRLHRARLFLRNELAKYFTREQTVH